MDVLVCLARHSPDPVSVDELVREVWRNRVVTDNSIYRVINQLRNAFGEDFPNVIQTIRKRGYRLAAPVKFLPEEQIASTADRFWGAAALVSAAVLLTGFAWWFFERSPEASFGGADELSWIVFADFENGIGESDLAEFVDEELVRELGSSGTFGVVPRGRINETLALMRRPVETPLTPEIAREIAIRDGGVRAVLSASLEKSGDTFVLAAQILNVENGAMIGGVTEATSDLGTVPEAARNLSSLIRQLAEQRIPLLGELPPPLERVTTDSLEALRLYSEVMAVSLDPSASGWDDMAERLLPEALQYDDAFASAAILLARAISNRSHDSDEYIPLAERAFALADDLPVRERYFIRGSYYNMIGADKQAVDEYRILARLHPDHYWGVDSLAHSLQGLGRTKEAARYLAVRADLLPTSPRAAALAAQRLAESGQLEKAQEYSVRASNLLDQVDTTPEMRFRTIFETLPVELAAAGQAWEAGNLEGVVLELGRLRQRLGTLAPDIRQYLSMQLANAYLALGQIDEAEDVLETHSTNATAPDFLYIPVGAEKPSRRIARDGIAPNTSSGFLLYRTIEMARVGQLAEAELRFEEALANRTPREAQDPTHSTYRLMTLARGEVLRAREEYAAAEDALTEYFTLSESSASNLWPWDRYIAAESLAILRERRGNRAGAMQILEETGALRSRADIGLGWETIFWMRNRLRLAELIREDDPSKAAGIEVELRTLLAFADEDHPVARALRERAPNDQF